MIIITTHSEKKLKSEYSLDFITSYEQVQDLINEFEPNVELREKNELSVDVLYRNKFCFFFFNQKNRMYW